MKKHEFLAFSLPYVLKVFCNEDSNPYRDYNHVRYGMEFFKNEYSYTPILHPLSDLTKEIEHKGEKFVPIVELAKMIYPNLEWRISSSGLYEIVGNGYMTFEYNYGYNCFLCNNSYQLDQLECLLKTIEWHFDIAGLIEKGEAIDVNTLPENPYK